MSFKLGLKVTVHNRSFIYEYLPSGRLEQEDGNELLQEDGHFLMWEGYDTIIIGNRLVQETGFNILLETGDYLEYDGLVPIHSHLTTESDFNVVQEDGYRLRVEAGSIDEVK